MEFLIKNFTRTDVNISFLRRIFKKFLETEKVEQDVELSLVFVGEKRIRKINRIYRGVDGVTDVLSFEGDYRDKSEPVSGVLFLGEIFICLDRAKKQSKIHKNSFQKEVNILFIHGLFHLLGYDHISDIDYRIMSKKERKILDFFYN